MDPARKFWRGAICEMAIFLIYISIFFFFYRGLWPKKGQ